MRQLTYTAISLFKACRRAYYWRYVQEQVPLQVDKCLSFGSVIHRCLAAWYRTRDMSVVLTIVDKAYPDRHANEEQRRGWHLATAMMRAYDERYRELDFKLRGLVEGLIRGPIFHPNMRRACRILEYAGRVDGQMTNGMSRYVLEHKTKTQVCGSTLDAIWGDYQTALYCSYLSQDYGNHGIIYNILVKPAIRQGKLTDEQFQERLAAHYAQRSGELFHRVVIDQLPLRIEHEVLADLWMVSREILRAEKHELWYRNTANCFVWNKPCPYYPLCSTGDNSNVLANDYVHCKANKELESDIA